jgi:hypothetical protein
MTAFVPLRNIVPGAWTSFRARLGERLCPMSFPLERIEDTTSGVNREFAVEYLLRILYFPFCLVNGLI